MISVPFSMSANVNHEGALAQAKPFKGAEPLKKKPGPKKQSQPKTKKPSAASAKKLDGRSSVSSGSESDSSDESDLEIQLPEEPSPIPPTRPSEPVAVAEYDTLRAVWSPRNRRPNVDKVKSALVAFKDVVKAVRDTWKEITQAIKTAENQHDNDKATKLKNDAALQRRLMDVVVSTTLSKGHPMIVEKYVLFHFLFLAPLAARCHGHRSQKRIESLSHVIHSWTFSMLLKEIMTISKGQMFSCSARGHYMREHVP